jgi:8-oxo-dGTP diphosphatase
MGTPGKDFVGVATPFYCLDEKGRILMQKRGQATRDERGRWDPGSGRLEKDLTMEENVKKEVREELGARCKIDEKLPPHSIFREQEGAKTHWLVIPFFVRVEPGEVEINESDKISELKWVTIDELPEPLHSGFKYTFEKYKPVFKRKLKDSSGD